MNFKFVYKICTKSEWQEVKSKGQLTGSKKDLEDGYIHFSGDDQVAVTLKKFLPKSERFNFIKSRYYRTGSFSLGASFRWNYVSTSILTIRNF